MSDYTTIRAISLTLKELLKANITDSTEPQLAGVTIELISPKEMQRAHEGVGLSVWLYRITRNGDLLNEPPARPQLNQLAHLSLPLTLHYLVTPITDDPEAKQAILGRALQVLNDHAILRGADLQDTLIGSSDQFRVVLEALTVDELARVWESLEEDFQLSAPYAVQVVRIDSDLEPVEAIPVTTKKATYAQILSSS